MKLLSICIPAYNRPKQLAKLLASIDGDIDAIEIVIGVDKPPMLEEVRAVVNDYKKQSKYSIVYHENEKNLGYDGNLRNCINLADGEFVLFLGDDDWFISGALNKYLNFLEEHMQYCYILRSYIMEHPDGNSELFRYFDTPKSFEPGIQTSAFMFKRTVSLGGVTFKRESALKYSTNEFDGMLLYQLYLVAEICLTKPSISCPFPVVAMAQSYRDDTPMFGKSESEKKYFQEGKVTFQNSINFTKGFLRIAEAIDKKHSIEFKKRILLDISKYSYPFLSIQRKRGILQFLHYVYQLSKETKINQTWHFYVYAFALTILGEKGCDLIILAIKKVLGKTPIL